MITRTVRIEDDRAFYGAVSLIRSKTPASKMLFFDIETTGLSASSSFVYLIGCLGLQDGVPILTQFFSEGPSDETLLLKAFSDLLTGYDALVHFNGQTFDIPYISRKMDRHGLPDTVSVKESIDIYKLLRHYKDLLGVDSMKQKSLERFIGLNREDIYDGGELIAVYNRYLALSRLNSLRSARRKLAHESSSSAESAAPCSISASPGIPGSLPTAPGVPGSLSAVPGAPDSRSALNNQTYNGDYVPRPGSGLNNLGPGSTSDSTSEEDSLLGTLLLHNHEDVLGMLRIAELLSVPAFFDGDFEISDITFEARKSNCDHDNADPREDSPGQALNAGRAGSRMITPPGLVSDRFTRTGSLKVKISSVSPSVLRLFDSKAVASIAPGHSISLERSDDCLVLGLPVYDAELKLFYPNYHDYFYLPAEDMAVHSSVSSFLDPSLRRRCTAATCYTRHQGSFFPLTKGSPEEDRKIFREDHKSFPPFSNVDLTMSIPLACSYLKLFAK